MFIKEINITGFKTFGVSTSLGPFVPGINILVGYNGSGKTSILDAIEFIFHDDYENLNKEQFNKLFCHDIIKKNKNVISVEIIFDNKDRTCDKLPDEFSIQRQTSLGMDNYFLDGKKMYREKFINSIKKLEIDVSAFRQGEVAQFATSSDKKRLDLLFNMIGYTKYSDNSTQLKLNTLVETRNKTMIEVNQCYDKLKEEHLFCEEFKKILRKKEWIVYEMEKKKLIDTKDEIQQLENKIIKWLDRQRNDKPKYMKIKSELETLECTLIENDNSFQALENIEKKVKDMIKKLENQKSDLEMSISSSRQNNEERENSLKKMNEDLESLETNIASEEKIIESMKSDFSLISTYVKELEVKYRDELWELDCLHQKLSKDHKPERDKSIHKSIKALQESIAKKQEYLQHYLFQKEEKNQKVMELVNKISSIKSEIENLKTSHQNDSKELNTLQKKIKIATDTSRVVTGQIEDVSEKLKLLQSYYKQNCKKLTSAVKCDVMYNRTVIENALHLFNNEKLRKKIDASSYHGFAVDCFQCDRNIEGAVLAVAGKYLFNFVFDYGKDSAKILQKTEDDVNLSVINLDLLIFPNKTLTYAPDAFALITQIKFEPAHQKLVNFMFGNVMVCRDVQAASSLCKKKKITCVTLSGNVFFPSGISEAGNWNENERNQIQIYRSISKQLEEIKNEEKQKDKLNQQKLSCTNAISESLTRKNILELQKEYNEQRRISLESELDMIEAELRYITVNDEEHKEIEDSIEKLTKRVEELQLKLNNNDQEEMTSEEYQRYKELKTSTVNLLKLYEEEEKKADKLNKKITLKLDILKETFLRTKNDLQKKIQKTIVAKEMEANLIKDEGIVLESKMKMLEEASKKLEAVQNEMRELQKVIEETEDIKRQKEIQVSKLKINVDANNIDMKELEVERDRLQKIIEKAQSKANTFSGVLDKNPDPELKNIEKLTMQQLYSLQNVVDEELRKISHNVDKNASEIFSRMHEDVKKAKTTMKTLDKDKQKIIDVKQNYKSALQKQIYKDLVEINKHFKDIIKKFIPQPHIELILITENQEYNVDQAKDVIDLDDLIGISMKFSEFENRLPQTINELSGGQKTVIALAFIIAIRKCYSLSVIMCDEIDQALDSSHRNTLCEILKEMTSVCQVFVTTFRPELLEIGNIFYRVEKSTTTSIIKKMDKQKTLNFLKSVKQG